MKITKIRQWNWDKHLTFEVWLVPEWWEFWKSKKIEYYSPMFGSYSLRLYPPYSFGKTASKKIHNAITKTKWFSNENIIHP